MLARGYLRVVVIVDVVSHLSYPQPPDEGSLKLGDASFHQQHDENRSDNSKSSTTTTNSDVIGQKSPVLNINGGAKASVNHDGSFLPTGSGGNRTNTDPNLHQREKGVGTAFEAKDVAAAAPPRVIDNTSTSNKTTGTIHESNDLVDLVLDVSPGLSALNTSRTWTPISNLTRTANYSSTTSVRSGSYYGGLLGNYKLPELSFFSPMMPSGNRSSSSSSSNSKPAVLPSPDSVVVDSTWVELLQKRKPDDTVTVADLERLLSHMTETRQQSNYVEMQSSLQQHQNTRTPLSTNNMRVSSNAAKKGGTATIIQKTVSSSSSQVGFPQPSILSGRDIQRGTCLAGALLGLFLGVTILPNLWLVGSVLGGMYGIEITKDLVEEEDLDDDVLGEDDEERVVARRNRRRRPKSMLARNLIAAGSKLATWTLQLFDYWSALWFLYKTGQLSYEYYKTYESLDRRFALQSKIDAWNGRFAEGKKKFDAWEQDNEVGRTILAGLRTVWLVDERARRRISNKRTSRYRAVQYLYNFRYWLTRQGVKAITWTKTQFAQGGAVQEMIEGIRVDLMSKDSGRIRVGSVVTALIAVNISGAIFSLSPAFSNLLGVLVAVVWPTWASELFNRVGELGEDLQAVGKRNGFQPPTPSSGGFSAPKLLGIYDKNRYHYYVRPDGKKRWYRTGNSQFSNSSPKGRGANAKKAKKNRDGLIGSLFGSFPWSSNNGKRSSNDGSGMWTPFRKTKS